MYHIQYKFENRNDIFSLLTSTISATKDAVVLLSTHPKVSEYKIETFGVEIESLKQLGMGECEKFVTRFTYTDESILG